jgi:CHAD domain-containing protein
VPDSIDPIIDRLKQLQDTAGDLHDVHVFTDDVIAAAQRAAAMYARQLATAVFKGDLEGAARAQRENPMPGIMALAARLREREARCFETLRQEWLDVAADDLLNQICDVADTLRAIGAHYPTLLHGD